MKRSCYHSKLKEKDREAGSPQNHSLLCTVKTIQSKHKHSYSCCLLLRKKKKITEMFKSLKESLDLNKHNYILIIMNAWRYQEFEKPETWLIVARLERVDEEEKEEAVKSQRVSLHRDEDAIAEETGQQADAPQHSQQACNLYVCKHTHTRSYVILTWGSWVIHCVIRQRVCAFDSAKMAGKYICSRTVVKYNLEKGEKLCISIFCFL